MLAAAWLLLRGRFGRSLRAVRDSELAAASSGVNLARYKTLAFGISAFYAGVAGSLLRDRDDVRQSGHVPDHPLDLPARRRRRRRARLALAARLRGDLHPLHADRVGAARGVRDPELAAGARRHRHRRCRARRRWPSASILILIMLVAPGWRGGRPCHPEVACDSRLPSRSLSLDQGAALPMRRPRLLIPCSCSPARSPRAQRPRRVRTPGSPTRRSCSAGRHRSPALRRLRVGRPRSGRVLPVRERARRRQRPHDHVQGTSTTRYNPAQAVQATLQLVEQDKRLRDLQLARHRAEPGGPPVPERGEGAAALRRLGRDGVRPDFRSYP